MGYVIRSNVKIALKEETTEGTYIAPASGADFVQALKDGESLEITREKVERNVFNGSVGQATARHGEVGVNGAIPIELKANGTEGAEPEASVAFESAFGAKRSAVTKTASDADGGTHSDTVICFEDADASNFAVGDVVMTKRSGAYHVSPITAVSNAAGDVNITLLIADPAGAYVDGIEVSAVSTYYPADSGHPSYSVSKYLEDAVAVKAWGCKTTSLSIEGVTTYGLGSFNIGYEGADGERAVSALPYTPTYDSALPPVIVNACAYQDTTLLEINELTLNLTNELAWIKDTCNGKKSSRVANRTVTGTIDPYTSDSDVNNWTKFNAQTPFSLFVAAKVPTGTSGEYSDVVAFYAPNCVISAMADGDQDGAMKDVLTFDADKGSASDKTELYMSFI